MIDAKLNDLHLKQITKPLTFSVGDTVKVHYKITEGDKSRVQIYEGVVITIKNRGAGKTFTVRRVSYDVGVERIFPLYNPNVEKVEVMRSGRVRRSKLYYLREKIGKHARLKEVKRTPKEDKVFAVAKAYQKKIAEEAKATQSAPEAEAITDKAIQE